jgi:predicted protein tyrosine phosphatase
MKPTDTKDAHPTCDCCSCARNRLRSPTAERVFAAVPGVEAESAGVAPDAEHPVTPELLAWAEVILVMEATQRAKLARQFPAALRGKRVVCLDVPDDYEYMAPELVRLLRERVGRAIPALATDVPE